MTDGILEMMKRRQEIIPNNSMERRNVNTEIKNLGKLKRNG